MSSSIGHACQVVPEIPSFAVDDGFTYLIPEGMPAVLGSKVRVRVSGRRLAGYVTATFPAPTGRKLLTVDSVTGAAPVFDASLLDVCRWAATHYVAPLSTVLKRTSPPNAPRLVAPTTDVQDTQSETSGTSDQITYTVSAAPHHDVVRRAVAGKEAPGAQAIVVPSAVEAQSLARHLERHYPGRVSVATSSMPAREVTASWAAASQDPNTILVGTREIILWKLAGGGSWIIVEEGRRVMKSPSTPTLHVREIAFQRHQIERAALAFVGPVPTLEAISFGVQVDRPAGRWWPVVEVSDRSEDPPGPALLTQRTRQALSIMVGSRTPSFVLVGARGYAPAFLCTQCSAVRLCRSCETVASDAETCRRCGARLGRCAACGADRFAPVGAGIGRVVNEIGAFAGDGAVGTASDDALITVGSERDLIESGPVGLAVVVDTDGMAGAPHYRASEDALRLLARTAQLVTRGDGHRMIVQTGAKTSRVVAALVAGRADRFLADEASLRKAAAFPPYGELIALEVDESEGVDELLREALTDLATVRGPAPMKDRERWLIQGDNLDNARVALRSTVGLLRARGAKVRVDADPIDL
ncbi:MAG: hypothetical protein DWP92_10270 [Armatimonadetes bacterium]|nr:MAG: hypothetical protein DWP92_10270 [Armatimonadota bacterium]